MSRRVVVAMICCSCLAMATIGYAASFTLTTKKLGAASVTTPVMFPDSVSIANKGGGHVGKPENGDIITLVYSHLVDAPTLCSGWTNTGSNANAKLQWSIIDGGASNDTLIADGSAAPCNTGLFIGTIDLGAPGFATGGNVTFAGTTATIAFGVSTTTITATLNGQKGTSGTLSGAGPATWYPDSAVTDRTGNNCGSNLAMTSSTTQF
jgi:hypothetical protein